MSVGACSDSAGSVYPADVGGITREVLLASWASGSLASASAEELSEASVSRFVLAKRPSPVRTQVAAAFRKKLARAACPGFSASLQLSGLSPDIGAAAFATYAAHPG